MNHFVVLAVGLVLMLIATVRTEAATLFVKVTATGTGDCMTWANACTLADAVAAAETNGTLDAIWVQTGVYPPICDAIDNEDVAIVGGFAGTETSASQSKPATYVTIIDGGELERCASVMDRTSATVLRGLKFVNGYDGDYVGGGALLLSNSSPRVVDCVFEYNTAAYQGGAVLVEGTSAPHFMNCIFRYNGATTIGGGPYGGGAIFQLTGTLTVVNTLFHDNRAGQGGAIGERGNDQRRWWGLRARGFRLLQLHCVGEHQTRLSQPASNIPRSDPRWPWGNNNHIQRCPGRLVGNWEHQRRPALLRQLQAAIDVALQGCWR